MKSPHSLPPARPRRDSLFAGLLLFATTIHSYGLGIILPIYGNTSSQFNAAEAAARRVPLIAIFNPDNGPGASKNSSYATSINKIKAAGGEVIGYISTAYTGVAIATVKSNMDKYISWYGVNGFFLDEMTDTTSKLSYYQSANSYAGGRGKFIVGNPGTTVPSSYLNAARILITFENPIASGWSGASAAGDSTRYGAIPYSAGSLGTSITEAVSKRFGWIYVTNRSEPDPFGVLPSYWSSEVAAVEAVNVPPLPAALPSSQFIVSSMQPTASGGVSVTFPAVARRKYGLQVSSNLTTWTAASTPDTPAVLSEITPAADGPVTLRAASLPGARSAFYRAVDLDTLAGR